VLKTLGTPHYSTLIPFFHTTHHVDAPLNSIATELSRCHLATTAMDWQKAALLDEAITHLPKQSEVDEALWKAAKN
jgi:hypothetical protein